MQVPKGVACLVLSNHISTYTHFNINAQFHRDSDNARESESDTYNKRYITCHIPPPFHCFTPNKFYPISHDTRQSSRTCSA